MMNVGHDDGNLAESRNDQHSFALFEENEILSRRRIWNVWLHCRIVIPNEIVPSN